MSTSSRDAFRLSYKQRTLLETLLKEEGLSSVSSVSIPPRQSDGPIPLSFAQERLWFLDQLEPNTSLYNISAPLCLTGQLNIPALERALKEIVRRHQVLRTSFSPMNGELSQQINPIPGSALPVIDLQHLSAGQRYKEVERLVHDRANEPFNLATGPLFRTTLLKLTPDEHVLLLNMHHIVADDWSFGVLHNELGQLYNAFASGTSLSLPETPIQYADFSQWQRQWMQGEILKAQVDYWKGQLAGTPGVLALPTDRPRPPAQTFVGATISFGLPEELSDRLQILARKEGVTLFMLLLAAFKTVLHRYSHQEDVVVGSPTANRNRVELENLIGLFVNTLVLRTTFSGNPSFRELLRRVREVALGAYSHQDLPFEKLVEELRPERSLSYSPLFQVLFVFQNPSLPALELDGLRPHYLEFEPKSSKFELSLYMYKDKELLKGRLEYNTDLFDASTIERLQGHLRTVLEEVVRDPDQRVDELPLLTSVERQELLMKWNDTAATYPEKDRRVHQIIEEQSERNANRVALQFEEQQLTYRQLNCKANQLAHYLRKLGVGPEVLVGLFVERSVEMIVGLLGILKAGGAYVPIDPEYPSDRVTFMLEDARVVVVLTQRRLAARLLYKDAKVIYLDDEWEQIGREDTGNPSNVVEPDHLAYTIYTSGSTGKPKGVQIEHRSLSNLLCSMRHDLDVSQEDTVLAVTTLSFDIAGLEIYLPLICGARLLLASYWTARDGSLLMNLLRQSRATVMQATPSTWGLLIEAGWDGSPPLKVLCGGEAMPPELGKKLTQRSRSVWNVYGPTETTIWSSLYRLGGHEQGPVSIGRPIANTQLYVLDAQQNPVPLNVSGELYIGGDGVARGYMNRPDLTAERFVPDPFRFMPDARLYRTGDLARRGADGNIDCLGRLDHQVKIRGFRIELGEVEAVLDRHEAVKQSVVVTREVSPGEQRLVAYFEPQGGAAPAVNDLRTHLKQLLPDYMVPSAFISVEKLPLTPNGKVDRKKLPSANEDSPGIGNEFVAPRDALEQSLAQLWSRVLKVKRVGVFDNFFDLGGHSLAAVRMVTEVRKLTGKNLPLATLFQAPTLGAIADILRKDGWAPSWSSLVPMQPLGSKRPLFLVHGAEGNVLLYQRLTKYLGPDQPVYGLQSQGLNGDGNMDINVQDMASRYVNEVVAEYPEGPYRLGGYCLGGIIAFEMAQQLTAMGKEVELVILLDTYNVATIVNRPAELMRRLFRSLQNMWFHSLNTLSLNSGNGLEFLREKLDIARIRTGVRVHALLHTLNRGSGSQKKNVYPHLAIKKLNDRAADQYVPRPYDGRVALVRSKGYFLDRTSPHFGWDKYVRGTLTVYELPMYPRAMLTEPFCCSLAKTLQSCLEEK